MTKILAVGDIMSYKDKQKGEAFSDGNGGFLKAMLAKTGHNPNRLKYMNVFPITADRGSVLSLCSGKSKGIKDVRYLKRGKYIRAEYASHLHNLWATIDNVKPNLVLALGDAALWATTSETSLNYARGYITNGHSALPDFKILPTYHPRQVQQQYDLKPILLADLAKAKREGEFSEIRRPQREVWLEPTIEDLEDFYHKYLKDATEISVDIENKPEMITCIGFAPNPSVALVIPFYDSRKPDGNYWPTKSAEIIAWKFVQRMLSLGKCVYGQNYVYDMQVLWRLAGIENPDFNDDTMLMHHALQPEMKKSLGFLASIYADEVSWKKMRTDTLKKED